MKYLLIALSLFPFIASANFTHHFHYENDIPKCDSGCFVHNDDCEEGTSTPPTEGTSTPPIGTTTPPTDGTTTPPTDGSSTPPTDSTPPSDTTPPPVSSSSGTSGSGHHHITEPSIGTTQPPVILLSDIPRTGYRLSDWFSEKARTLGAALSITVVVMTMASFIL